MEDMLQDRLVCGVNDERLQQKLLVEPQLTFKKAMELSQTFESSVQDSKDLQSNSKVPRQIQLMEITNRRLNVIVVEGSITLTSVNTKSLYVTIVIRRVILPRGVTNMINLVYTIHHI